MPIETIDQALAEGWDRLECVCPNGHGLTLMPWPLLAARTKTRVIAEITPHLVCSRCGGRPTSFALIRHRPSEGRGQPLIERLVL